MPITACTYCGGLYEAGSEEQANEPVRLCKTCKPMCGPRYFYRHYDESESEYVVRFENEHGDVPVCVTDDEGHAEVLVSVLQGALELDRMTEIMSPFSGDHKNPRNVGFYRGTKNANQMVEGWRLNSFGAKPINMRS